MHGQPGFGGIKYRHPVGHVAERRLAAAPPARPPEHRADAAGHEQVGHGADLGLVQGQHRGGVTGLALAPDGKSLVTADYTGTLLVWDVAGGKVRHRLKLACRLRGLKRRAQFPVGGRNGL